MDLFGLRLNQLRCGTPTLTEYRVPSIMTMGYSTENTVMALVQVFKDNCRTVNISVRI